ncbi:3'(2'),5'-bisphosphate nucleotidase CysQ [Caldimonas tepidiphila]|uniref:3'(2'),5'-bisphosphate nucleotidase CysQ n=1 Tax=Caldimonas tepidiphila TaxID=2315841 RepID=UPI00196A983F
MQALLAPVCDIARIAGRAILEIYGREIVVQHKQDASPVTEADARAEALILEALGALLPGVPVVAEESVSQGRIPAVGDSFWLVDPLDGTKEFINRNGEFTVNIALVRQGVPVLGVVLAPALGRLFAGMAGAGATLEDAAGCRSIRVREPGADGLVVVGSRSHGDAAAMDAFLGGTRVAALRGAGSSLKFCLVAAAEADLYPRLGRTMEWDTAAGHAVLLAAGGRVLTREGQALRYGKAGFENPHFVAAGFDWQFSS